MSINIKQKPAKIASAKNCLNCERYTRCTKPEKSVIFICKNYKEYDSADLKKMFELAKPLNLGFDPLDPSSFHITEEEAEADNKIFKMFELALDENRRVAPDMRIPEGDFPKAENFYDWCVNDQFGNTKPFIEQAITGIRFFADYCPKCSDMEYLEHDHKVNDSLHKLEKKVALLVHGKCPYCKLNRRQLYKREELNLYQELALCWGQRSGKNQFFAMGASYYTHRMMKLENPIEAYNAIKSVTITASFIALTAANAQKNCWTPYMSYLEESPWFVSYIDMLKHYEHKYGEGTLVKIRDTTANFKHRRFLAHFAGPDERILRGYTRGWATIDELGLFSVGQQAEGKVKINGAAVYQALKRSLTTIRVASLKAFKQGFYDVPLTYFCNISSPRSTRDMIMTRYKASLNSRTIMGSKKATWEINPEVTKKVLAEEFRTDPVGSERDYGANPPLSSNPFISNQEIISDAWSKKPQVLKLQTRYVTTSSKQQEMYAEAVTMFEGSRPSILTLDAGHVFNSFAFAVGHRSKNGYPVISLVGEVIPEAGIKINFNKIYNALIKDIIVTRNVQVVYADRWNSLKILSDIDADFGIPALQYSVNYKDCGMLRDYLASSQIILPRPKENVKTILGYDHTTYPYCFKNKPAEHLFLQLCTVQDAMTSVIKGDDLTDDIARAVFLCVRQLVNDSNDEYLSAPDKIVSTISNNAQVAVRLGSGGGNVSSSGSHSSVGVMKTYRK